ncbi:hypothetical protein pipiens_003978 [Culex pipiens pipiens]|uniref:Uncharacterized protein n=1 Tax=Culex pipiens pipiens TaxID=38569 RepID=A0ABD1CQ39_CULPP
MWRPSTKGVKLQRGSAGRKEGPNRRQLVTGAVTEDDHGVPKLTLSEPRPSDWLAPQYRIPSTPWYHGSSVRHMNAAKFRRNGS